MVKEEGVRLPITINPAPLREIIDYEAFLCDPGSSVARGETREGSDIDGGLVVLREPVDERTQKAFVRALRGQGFSVFHSSEVDRFAQLYEDDPDFLVEKLRTPYEELLGFLLLARTQVVSFMTVAELEALPADEEGGIDNPWYVYHHRYAIDRPAAATGS